jgi:hypothetical protein
MSYLSVATLQSFIEQNNRYIALLIPASLSSLKGSSRQIMNYLAAKKLSFFFYTVYRFSLF